jgi:hypothetical protein
MGWYELCLDQGTFAAVCEVIGAIQSFDMCSGFYSVRDSYKLYSSDAYVVTCS